MTHKRIGVSESMKNLIINSGLFEYPEFREEKSETISADLGTNLVESGNMPVVSTWPDPQSAINDSDYLFPYLQSAVNAQAREDIRQSNEAVAEMVVEEINGCLVLRKSCRNHRWRDVFLTMKGHRFRVFKYRSDGSEEEIIQITFLVDEKVREIWGKKSGIFGKKMYQRLYENGVEFNMSLSERRQKQGICNFISQLTLNVEPRLIPLRHGWYEEKGELIFCKSKAVWKEMENMCVF